jgi:hypothetical protein
MMTFWKHLWRIELAAVICLVLYAAAFTGVLALGAGVFATDSATLEGAARSFALILWFSILPTMLFFAPFYALLARTGHTNFPVAIILGVLSSVALVMLFRNGAMALYAIPSGAVVGAATHAIAKWLAPRIRLPIAG